MHYKPYRHCKNKESGIQDSSRYPLGYVATLLVYFSRPAICLRYSGLAWVSKGIFTIITYSFSRRAGECENKEGNETSIDWDLMTNGGVEVWMRGEGGG